nr:immunoglobulin heavy chain junction region [Mus musculus]
LCERWLLCYGLL